MAPGRPRDERKERQWQRWLDQWRRSGLSVRAFCARHDLSEPSFYAWRKRLGCGQPVGAAFVPVRVLAEAEAGYPLEVVLAGGRRLRIAAHCAAQTLRQVLGVLEEGSTC